MNVNGSWKINQLPEPAALHAADFDQVHRAGDHHRHDDAQAQRHFVADHLGRLAHRPEQRPLRARGVAGQDHAENFQPGDGQDEEHRHVQSLRHPAVGQAGWPGKRENDAQKLMYGAMRKSSPSAPAGNHVFLGDQLDAVGQRLQPAELAAHPRRTEPILDPPGNLPLHPDKRRAP